jgi:hypothetical protein
MAESEVVGSGARQGVAMHENKNWLGHLLTYAPLLAVVLTGVTLYVTTRVQFQLAELKSTQDKELEQAKRELAAPKLIVAKNTIDILDDRNLSSMVQILNSSGSEATRLRVDISISNNIKSISPLFPHQQAAVEHSPDGRSGLVRLETLAVGEALNIELTFELLPDERIIDSPFPIVSDQVSGMTIYKKMISNSRGHVSYSSRNINVKPVCSNCITQAVVEDYNPFDKNSNRPIR